MEPNETGLRSYYQHQTGTSTFSPTGAVVSVASAANGLLLNHGITSAEGNNPVALFPHSVAGKAPATLVETVRRKRGRPRKYDTPEAAAAPKRSASSQAKKKEKLFSGTPSSFPSSKKSELVSIGNAGQGFTPHVINVAAEEDVAQKIMLFMQQTRRELCVLSASGSVSNVSLCQPATSGGNITYEGHFDILSLSGSFVCSDCGGRAGGLSACLSSTDGQIVGGGVGGPLIAAGPVEVIVGSFLFGPKKDVGLGIKGDASASTLPTRGATPTTGYRPVVESSGRFPVTRADDHQYIGGSLFMVQPTQDMHALPLQSTNWASGLNSRSSIDYGFMGRTVHGAQESTENGDYYQMHD